MRFLSRISKVNKGSYLLILAFLVGLILRVVSVKPGYLSHGDELMYSQAIYMYLHKTLSFEPHWMGYPPLVAWIMLFSFTVVFIPAAWIVYLIRRFQDIVSLVGGLYQMSGSVILNLKNIFNLEILGRYWINALYWGRYVTVFFGALVVVLIYLTTVNLFKDRKAAILTAIFSAVNYRLVLSSHIGFIDMYNVFFLLLSFWAISILYQKPNIRTYIFAWVSVAFSFLVKYQIYAFFPLFLVHFYLSINRSEGSLKMLVKRFFGKGVILGGLTALVIVAVFHFYHVLYLEKIIELNRYQVSKYGFGKNNFDFFPLSYLYHIGVGPMLSLISVAGIFICAIIKKFRFPSLIILSPLPFIAFIYLYYSSGGFYTRNIIVVIPIFLIFSSVLLSKMLDFTLTQKSTLLKLFGISIFSLVIFFCLKDHLINSLVLASTYSKESQESLAQKWIETNIKGEGVFGTNNNRLIPLDKNIKLKPLPHPDIAFSFKELQAEGYNFAVVDLSSIHSNFLTWWMRQATNIGIKFWQRPDNLIAQDFKMLALRELMWDHALNSFLTKWQAPGYNFGVFKINNKSLCDNDFEQFQTIQSLDWTPLYFLSSDRQLLYKENGNRLVIANGRIIQGGSRWESSAFEIKGNFCYKVTAKIKNKEDVSKRGRQAFVRLNFYKDKPETLLTSRSMVSFLSERIYGSAGSHKVDTEAIAPAEAKYATVSFQVDDPQTTHSLDDLEVFQSKSQIYLPERNHMLLKDENILLFNDEGIL